MILAVVLAGVATTVMVLRSGDDEFVVPQIPQLVNDVSRLNAVWVAEVISPQSVEDIQQALRDSDGRVSIGGGRYSQGGQTAYPDSLHIDMRSFNKVLALDTAKKQVTVQTGISWRQLQSEIDPHNLSIKIMQTYANFSVGGSLSVNVHGRYIGEGPLVGSVLGLKLVLADGSLITASPQENADIFYGAIGGYGGLGVIVEATLQLEDNLPVERKTRTMPVDDYAAYFHDAIRDNGEVVFHNADIYPPDFTHLRDVSWYASDRAVTKTERLIPADQDYRLEVALEKFVAGSNFGKWSRQHLIDPLLYYPEKVVWRNYEASYDVAELEPDDRSEYTYGLR
ncbi:MAG: FAD/FMN-containing dehydrogenase, partial [Zhongshania marina]